MKGSYSTMWMEDQHAGMVPSGWRGSAFSVSGSWSRVYGLVDPRALMTTMVVKASPGALRSRTPYAKHSCI